MGLFSHGISFNRKKKDLNILYRENLVKTYKLSGRPKKLTIVNQEDTVMNREPGRKSSE